MSDNKNSQYDAGLIFKEVHDFYGKSLRVSDSKSIVDKFYTHFRVSYTPNNLPSEVSYFRGTQAHKTALGCISDVNKSLQNRYIKLFSAPDNKCFHLWFNVNEEGTEPIISNSTGIEIPINENDDSSVIAMAIALVINTMHKTDFYVSRSNSAIEISPIGMGIISNSQDFGTNFALVNTAGKQELISYIEIEYQDTNPIYKGQVLKNYIFNVFSGHFELKENNSAVAPQMVWDEISTTFPEANKDLYSYKNNSVLVQEVLVTYADSNKKSIVSVQKTRF
jgi:hypothetical protein